MIVNYTMSMMGKLITQLFPEFGNSATCNQTYNWHPQDVSKREISLSVLHWGSFLENKYSLLSYNPITTYFSTGCALSVQLLAVISAVWCFEISGSRSNVISAETSAFHSKPKRRIHVSERWFPECTHCTVRNTETCTSRHVLLEMLTHTIILLPQWKSWQVFNIHVHHHSEMTNKKKHL